MELWQLKKLSTNEPLNEPQRLPENWGPIFGLSGFIDKLNDLSWLGSNYHDMGWFIVGESAKETVQADEPVQASESYLTWQKAKKLLLESDWSMLPDVPMTVGKKSEWIEYRRALREIRLQPNFPSDVLWPKKPD